MRWIELFGRSMIAASLSAASFAQADRVLGEFPSGNRVTASREYSGGTDSVPGRAFIPPPPPPAERDPQPQTTTPLGVPSPPHHLTPAPLLPFHPNRPLMPPPTIPPPPSLGSGHIGR